MIGIKVIVVSDHIKVERSWRERLFTLPWHPTVKEKIVPNPARLAHNVVLRTPMGLLMSPSSHAELLKQSEPMPDRKGIFGQTLH